MSAQMHDLRAQRLAAAVPELERLDAQELLDEIAVLKRARHAVVLAHNYQAPLIYHGVADFTGDSLALAQQAARSDAEVIVLAGVAFMAETAKLLNPARTVLLPASEAGCSLAESITAEDVRALRRRHPGAPVVSYVNTSAAVKAESDVCCTSANALRIVESLGAPKVIFLPDRYLGHHVQQHTGVELVLWDGACEVHQRFSAAELRDLRARQAGLHILAHPECPPDVLQEADFVGSTQGMVDHLTATQPAHVALITECSMSDNVAVEFPQLHFLRPCNLCPHMRRITLTGIRDALLQMQHVIELDAAIAAPARRALERMLAVGRG